MSKIDHPELVYDNPSQTEDQNARTRSITLVNDSKEESYAKDADPVTGAPRALGLVLVSIASAVAGGLAMAWWNRKTLSKLQNPIAGVGNGPDEFKKPDSTSE